MDPEKYGRLSLLFLENRLVSPVDDESIPSIFDSG